MFIEGFFFFEPLEGLLGQRLHARATLNALQDQGIQRFTLERLMRSWP